MGFIIRWLCAFFLLAATFNPTDYNYLKWIQDYGHLNLSITVFFGLLLLIGYIVYLRATLRSIGGLGIVLVLAIVVASVWVLYDLEIIKLDDSHFNTWLALFALSFVLGVGLSWSIFRRAVTGQTDMDDVED
ncbi:DUF6524 family protein [Sulfitobacter sp.]|uniref:DUF6524 family protein n=1 Tax=Sulfitobacter sp. TaxID=1903071 RepID=UPI003565BF62